MENHKPKKGVITKLFGVVLMFLGVLDGMLSWRGGLGVSDFYVLLIAVGMSLYIVGAIRRGSQT